MIRALSRTSRTVRRWTRIGGSLGRISGPLGRLGLLAALAAAAGAPPVAAQEDEKSEATSQAVDPQLKAQAMAALGLAAGTKNSARGKDPDDRFSILQKAGAEYEDVGTRYAAVTAVSGEAWFRAGEIWRVLRRLEQSERCFQSAVAVTANPGFAARALVEVAHLKRRSNDLHEALARYAAVEKRFPGERLQGVRARTWQGKLLIQLEKTEEGHRRLLSVGDDYADFPVEHVRNTDMVAVAWCKAGRVEEARGLIERLRQTYAEAPKDEKARAEVVKAMARMKAPALIEPAGSDARGGSKLR